MKGSIVNLYSVWLESTDWERSDGITYYQRQRSKIIRLAGGRFHDDAAIGAFAALSPNNDEDGNYRDLETVMGAVVAGVDTDRYSTSTYGPNKRKAHRILQESGRVDPLDILGGPKVRSFYRCTLDPRDPEPVCVDGHMVSCWAGRRLHLVRGRRGIDSAVINDTEYQIIAAAIRALASGLMMVPSQLQSTLWVTWKRYNKIRYNPQLSLDL